MPAITIYRWPPGDNTIVSTGLSSAVSISNDSALSFDAVSFASNITIGQYNDSTTHIAQALRAATNMGVLHNFTWLAGEGSDTSFALNGTHSTNATAQGFFKHGDVAGVWEDASPKPWRGLGFLFKHDTTNVNCDPVRFWAGSGSDVDGPTQQNVFKAADLTLASSDTKKWIEATVAAKLTCSAHTGTAVRSHLWTFATTMSPTDVGAELDNKVKLSITYF